MSGEARRVAVVGGGIAGLATALALQDAAEREGRALAITVLEAADRVGGKLQTRREDGWAVEEGPNGFLDSEPATLELVRRLELQEELARSGDAARRRFLLLRGRLQELPLTPGAFLRSGLLGPAAKLRMAAELLVPRRRDLGRAAEDPATDETVYDFGRRRLGRAFAETLLDPMVKGIWGGDARRTSLAAAFPRMVELEREHGSLLRALARISRRRRREGGPAAGPGPSGVLHSFRHGMAVLPRRAAERLRAELILDAPVREIRPDGDGWRLVAGERERGPFAAVVDAAPAHAACRHLPTAPLRELVGGIRYAPLTVIALGLAREAVAHPLDGFGMLVPGREGRRLLGVLWSSSIWPGRAPRGRVLLRCMAGGADLLDGPDAAAIDLALAELRQLYGLRGEPERAWVLRHERAIAQYEVGHLARLAAAERELAGLPGLLLAGSSYRGISVNHCVAEAPRTARAVLDHLAGPARPAAAGRGSPAGG